MKATELDLNYAMSYLGIAMSSWYPLWYPPTKESLTQGLAAVDKARALAYEKTMQQP